MGISSFSMHQRVTSIAGAIAIALISWAYFGRVWRGVIVSGAGDISANGYYKWEPAFKSFVKSEASAGGWRVPNVHDLVSGGPEYRSKNGISTHVIKLDSQTNRRLWFVWNLIGKDGLEYQSRGARSNLHITPPSTGWKVDTLFNTTMDDLQHPPKVTVCGRTVAPYRALTYTGRDRHTRIAKALTVEDPSMGSDIDYRYAGTLFLLGVQLAVAYYLWRHNVSPDAVAISNTLFWEQGEYWRLFTASFSHFEIRHLGCNTISTWNMRWVERRLGTNRYLCLTLVLVVATTMVDMLIKHTLVKRKVLGSQWQQQKAVGFSCVLFAYITYTALVKDELCPFGGDSWCFKTWRVPIFASVLPDLPLNIGPFVLLVSTQVTKSRASFTGHLAGIIMGFPLAWGLLGGLSIPIVAGISVIFIIQHSRTWAHKITSLSPLPEDWACTGVSKRIVCAWRVESAFRAHTYLTVAILFLFTWSSVLAEMLALIVGHSALQALKGCCSSHSEPTEHRICVKLLTAYGMLSAILVVSDLLSFGAILGQWCFIRWSGVSEFSLSHGLASLAIATIVHAYAVMACLKAGAIVKDGQMFLSDIGLGRTVIAYSLDTNVINTPKTRSSFLAVLGRLFLRAKEALDTVGSTVTHEKKRQ